jgi:pentatricopeptide repeat protein
LDYKKVYDSIISKRQKEIPQGYKERHHIIPRSFGGTNEKENLVYLTAREHFLCHYLLIKIHTSGPEHYKAIHAFMMMNVTCSYHQRITSRLFEKYRIEFSQIMSEHQSKEKNSQFGKRWITNGKEETKIPKESLIPEGWIEGRITSSHLNCICKFCGKVFTSKINNKYCSKECRRNNRKGSSLDNHLEDFIKSFLETGSINKALKVYRKMWKWWILRLGY